MIEKIRKPKKSRNLFYYTFYVLIFGMIVATFIFMIPGLGGGTGAVTSAAEVGKASISLRDYSEQLKFVRGQYQKMFKGEVPPFFEASIKSQVMETLVRQEVLKQYAKRESIVVSDLEVADVLKRDISAFQEDGRFSLSRYNQYLKAVRSTPSKFEDKIYKDLLVRRLTQAFQGSMGPTSAEKKMAEEMSGVQVGYTYLKWDKSTVKSKVNISNEAIQIYLSEPESIKKLQSTYKAQKANHKTEDGKEKRFEDVKTDLARDFLQEQGAKELHKQVLELLKVGDNTALSTLLGKAGLSWSSSETYSLSDAALKGVGASDFAISTLFDLKDGAVSSFVPVNGVDYLLKKQGVSFKEKPKGGASSTLALRRNEMSTLDLVYQNEKKVLGVRQNQKL